MDRSESARTQMQNALVVVEKVSRVQGLDIGRIGDDFIVFFMETSTASFGKVCFQY